MNQNRPIRVALLGAGSVGSQVARILLENADELAARVGAPLLLTGIAVRNVDAKRDVDLPKELFTDDAERLILGSDIVIELMGGIDPAKGLISLALSTGADVVTANKALIAAHGPELFDQARRVGAQLTYEAAVAGAIPIIRPLRDSLAGDRVERILGIVNGTTNFILDRMHTRGDSLEEALRIATELGYAEADPTADIGGYDAQQKAAILASIAFHTEVPVELVHREGITEITIEQIERAKAAGFVVKLLAICERVTTSDGVEGISARVYPALVDAQHPLASVHGGNNAVFVQAQAAGDLMFYGAGAGELRPHLPCSATSSRRLGVESTAAQGSVSRPTPTYRSSRSARSRPATRSFSRCTTVRVSSPRSRRSSATSASRSRRSSSAVPERTMERLRPPVTPTASQKAAPRLSSARTPPQSVPSRRLPKHWPLTKPRGASPASSVLRVRSSAGHLDDADARASAVVPVDTNPFASVLCLGVAA